MILASIALAFGICPASAPVIPAQLAMKRNGPPIVPGTPKPSSPPAKSAGELTPTEQARLAEALNRLSPKQRKQLAKAVKRMTPDERRQFLLAMKRQMAASVAPKRAPAPHFP